MTVRIILPLLRYAGLLLALGGAVILCIGLAETDRPQIYAGLLFTALGLVVARGSLSLIETDVDVFNPTVVFVYFFFFFHLLQPTLQYFLYGIPENALDYLTAPLWTTLAGVVAFEAAMSLYRPRQLDIPQSMHLDRGILLILPPMVLVSREIAGALGFGGVQLGYLVAILAMLIWQQVPSRAGKAYAIFLVFVAIAMSIGEFTRAFIGQVILIVVLYVHYHHRRLPLWGAVCMGIAIFPVMVVGALFRSAGRIPELKDAEFELGRFFGFVFEFALDSIQSLDRIYYFTMQIDFPISYEGYVNIVNFVPRYVDYVWGLTYYRTMFFFIPRSLWPEKPENITSEYVYAFIAPEWTDYSVGVLLLGEFYWNFGLPGVIAGMFLLGLLIRFLQQNIRSFVGNPLAFFLFASFVLVIPQIMRGASSTIMLYATIWKFVPIVMIFFLLNGAPRLYWRLVAIGREQASRLRGTARR